MKAAEKDQEVLPSPAEASGRPSPPTPPHLLLATRNWGPLRGTVRRALLTVTGWAVQKPTIRVTGKRVEGTLTPRPPPGLAKAPPSRSPVLTAHAAPHLLALTSLMHLKEMRGGE